jgi:hypothetical protein
MDFTDYGISLEPEELREIITGKIGFRKCPDCEGHGESWILHYVLADDPDQSNEQFKIVSAQYAADFDEDNIPSAYSWAECDLEECETCYSVGYIPISGY